MIRKEASSRQQPRTFKARLIHFVNDSDIEHELVVIVVSYVFILAGAWNDGLLGLTVTPFSRGLEIFMALVLVTELISRLTYTRKRGARFWIVALLDGTAVLTVIPGLMWIAFARVARLFYASARLTVLLDRVSRRRRNAMWLMVLLPFIVPLMAAAVFAIEKHTPNSDVHNYFQALSMCFAYSLSLGNIRPTNPWSMAICGALFIIGIICIGVITNSISDRYRPKG